MDIRQVITDKIITLLERGTASAGPRWTGGKAKAADYILACRAGQGTTEWETECTLTS